MEFRNKTVIVTGASIGIGKAAALEFARQGANVCIVDINEQNLGIVEEEIRSLGANVLSCVCDVSKEEKVHETVTLTVQKWGTVDILVNCAGIWRFYAPFVETESENWKRIIEINILGTMYFSQAVLPYMLKAQYGRIINIGSVAGTYGNANMVAYSMSKGAIRSFTKALAKEVAAEGITVNNVVPGNVKNEGNGENEALSFMNRSGRLEEFADLICFLASDKAAYISGQDYVIDGCRKKM